MKKEDKLRLLLLSRLFFEKTDEDHFLSTSQIMDILEKDYHISAYRMTVSSDIDLLIQAGMDIQKVRSRQNLYHLVSRPFDLPEPKMLIDAVTSSKFITAKKSNELISGIMQLAGEGKALELKRNLCIDDYYKTENEQVYLIADAINEAINRGVKISFQLAEYNTKKERVLHNQGERYVFSPYELVWDGDCYYAVGYSEKYQGIGSHRIDRIWARPTILEEKAHAVPADFTISDYTHTMFRMFSSHRERVELICPNDVMDTIVDKFGKNVETFEVDESHFGATPVVAVNHIFFSWIFGFDGRVTIQGPENVKKDYQQMVARAAARIEPEKEKSPEGL